MLDTITTFLGWATLFHFVMLGVMAAIMIPLRGWATGIHARMFGVNEAEMNLEYFKFLARYKILIIVFFLVPYLVLRVAM